MQLGTKRQWSFSIKAINANQINKAKPMANANLAKYSLVYFGIFSLKNAKCQCHIGHE
jgi:hypothetical protein